MFIVSSIVIKLNATNFTQLSCSSAILQGDDEAISLLESMKEATMLFQKAIYLEVLKITASEKTLTTYLSKGGWDLLNSWLSGNLKPLLVNIHVVVVNKCGAPFVAIHIINVTAMCVHSKLCLTILIYRRVL